jgi:hypothetical protein
VDVQAAHRALLSRHRPAVQRQAPLDGDVLGGEDRQAARRATPTSRRPSTACSSTSPEAAVAPFPHPLVPLLVDSLRSRPNRLRAPFTGLPRRRFPRLRSDSTAVPQATRSGRK